MSSFNRWLGAACRFVATQLPGDGAMKVFVPASGGQFAVSVVFSNQPVLAVEILAPAGHTNEVQWSTDIIPRTRSRLIRKCIARLSTETFQSLVWSPRSKRT